MRFRPEFRVVDERAGAHAQLEVKNIELNFYGKQLYFFGEKPMDAVMFTGQRLNVELISVEHGGHYHRSREADNDEFPRRFICHTVVS